jgi:hypothetical protein
MKSLRKGLVVAVSLFCFATAARAGDDGDECTLNTLRGTYLFAASGYNIVGGVPQPKTIIEIIDFHGDGTLSVPAVTRSVNGVVARVPPGGTGGYTVEADCSGTISFDGSPITFDMFFTHRADTLSMIQTTQNTVFQGTAKRQHRSHDQD